MEHLLLLQEGLLVYVFLAGCLIGGAFGLPIPEDLPLIIGGILAHQGKANIWLVFLVCYSSILVGDLIVFSFGRTFGPTIFAQKWFKKRVTPARVRHMRRGLEKRSLLTIFIARHLFHLRSLTFLTCGAVGMKVKKFVLADAIAACVSAPLMISIGYFIADNYEAALRIGKHIEYGVLLVTLLLLGFLVYRIMRRNSEKKSGVSETPPAP